MNLMDWAFWLLVFGVAVLLAKDSFFSRRTSSLEALWKSRANCMRRMVKSGKKYPLKDVVELPTVECWGVIDDINAAYARGEPKDEWDE